MKRFVIMCLFVIMLCLGMRPLVQMQEQEPLVTRWAVNVSPTNVHPEYPRPQLVRSEWLNLNGLWDYVITDRVAPPPESYSGEILVPFPVESTLSGVGTSLYFGDRLWYYREFEIPTRWDGERIRLHFGAVDWEAVVFVNGVEIGTHQGGYDSFSFDITDALLPAGPQKLMVAVTDLTDMGLFPRGKQVLSPEGIWYTPTSGIWQTVWIEPVPHTYIDTIRLTPDIDAEQLHLEVAVEGALDTTQVQAQAFHGDQVVAAASVNVGSPLMLGIENPSLWSPNTPFLYDLVITLSDNDRPIDQVTSYFGMRKIALGYDDDGFVRLFLNNEPLFNFGLLDQGFWPDGLYTAPTDEALRYDIEVTLQLGFNTIRKHVKVEPERWYYWADRLGVLVWQDMPSGDEFVGSGDGEINRISVSSEQFELELQRMIDTHYNHPSVIMWVVFNEGWGQFDTVRLTEWLQAYDPSRLVNSVSGWNDMEIGDVHDIHSYPGPDAPPHSPDRALVLGEFGGLGLPIDGHLWQEYANWGYRGYEDEPSLLQAYTGLINNLGDLIESRGLAAAIYTQTTDVETEVNGVMTYDRAVTKLDDDAIISLNNSLYDR